MNKVLLGGRLGAASRTAAADIVDEDDDKENGPRKYDLSKKVAGDTVQEVLKQLDKLDWDLINLHLEAYDDGEGRAAQSAMLREKSERVVASSRLPAHQSLTPPKGTRLRCSRQVLPTVESRSGSGRVTRK